MINLLRISYNALKRRNTSVFTFLMTAAVTSSFANAPNLDKGVITSNNFKKTGMHNTKLLLNNKQTTIRGKIIDKDNNALAGVNISVVGSKESTLSAADGSFTIKGNIGVELVFTYVGFNKVQYKVESLDNNIITLTQNSEELEEAVVVGFGTQKKSSVVSSITSVKGSDLRFPTRNLTNNLAGQLPGLIAIQRSGEPGYDNSEFWIRGVSSFSGGTSPLVLVDGIPRAMQDIEPDEIETFTLLKDAAATAVYGAEGANGVIIITSKRGMSQKTQVNYRGEYSVMKPTRLPEFLNSADYMMLYNEALRNEGSAIMFSEELIENYRKGEDLDLYPNTNWLDLMLDDKTNNMRHTLNFRGGGDIAKFFVSGAYFTESGIFKQNELAEYNNNIGLKRYNLRSNVDLQVTKSTSLFVDLSGQYLTTNYPGVGTGLIFQRMTTIPSYIIPARYSDGTIPGHPRPSNNRINPYNLLMESGYAKEWRSSVQSNVGVKQNLNFITEGLTAQGNISYDAVMNYYMTRTKTPKQFYATGRNTDGSLIYREVVAGNPDFGEPVENNSGNKNIYLEMSLRYNRKFLEKHDVGGMLLTYQKESQLHSEALAFRKQGYVGRVTYGYDNRYAIEGNFGFTGSETFAQDYRFGFFPAVGASWTISNEPFLGDNFKSVVNNLRLRASLGRTGNDNTGGARFLYRGTFATGAAGYPFGIGGSGTLNGLSGLIEGRFEAPYLSWEIEDKKNLGLEIGLWNNKIDLQVDYFDNHRSNILLQRRTVSSVAGFRQNPWQNFGKVTNKGIDGSLNIRQKIGNEFILSVRGNVTYARNKIIEYDEIPQLYPWMNDTGNRLRSWNLYIADGLYKHDDFIITDNNGTKTYELKDDVVSSTLSSNIRPGDIKYKDLNGDGIINQYDQTKRAANPNVPELIYGFGLSGEYKSFYANIFFQGAGKVSTVLGAEVPAGFFPFQWGVDESNLRVQALDRWTEENPSDDVFYPRLHSATFANNSVASTWWLRDASFIRLKNVELGYRFKETGLSKYGLKSGRIYLNGNNIHVWDNIKMWDPELGNKNEGLNYPIPSAYTFGIEFNF
ncbi:SusC/RagA family TonB-linked outer membrane protein [Sphingobacterium cavernae]|uniref:SusC/RagA family TonB-linked outer membrane protein n=1 Tax=Sphingobacterium cavernae TaxID=2592657 RepID=UPI001CB7B507|nr:TonB-dependent receptor [Sphingobacterium cavernae]